MTVPVGYASLFTDTELKCRCGCGLLKLHRGFRDELVALRMEFGRPMKVTSCCRCAKHNDSVGGHPRSLHVGDEPQHPEQSGTLAIDIATSSGLYRASLFALAWQRGWSLGWGNGFLHLDRRDWVGLPATSFDY